MRLVCEKLSDYIKFLTLMLKETEGNQHPYSKRFSHVFENAESSEAFNALVAVCVSTIKVPKDRFYSLPVRRDTWVKTLADFFRRSGIYLQIADGDLPTSDEVIEQLLHEVNRKKCTVTYLALIDGIGLDVEKVRFGEFTLKYINVDALKSILNFRNRSLFYPHTLTNFSCFQNHYFLVVTEQRETGFIGILDTFNEALSSTIPTRPTRFPPPVEKGLRILALYNWVSVWQKDDEATANEKRNGWYGFNVPAIITVTDDLFYWPDELPSTSKIAMEPVFDDEGEEIGEMPMQPIFQLDEQETENLAMTLVELYDALSLLESNKAAGFIRNATDFLLKGFLSERLEQLLWHIIAIEAALGEQLPNESITGVLRRRLGLILGDTNAASKKISNAFRDLYSLRSGLVHGGHPRKDVFEGHLAEARRLARVAVVWAIRGFSFLVNKGATTKTLAPKRSDLLRLLDTTEDERLRLGAQISWLPNEFPRVTNWTK
jgi:hypothetical protein